MTSRPGITFLLWFAWLELWNHRRTRRITAVCVITVLFLGLFSICAFGLVLGYQKHRTEQFPLCQWIGSPVRGEPFHQGDLDRLATTLKKKFPGEDWLRGCFPFHPVDDYLLWYDGANPDLLRTPKGRTLAPGDPLLDIGNSTIIRGRRFESESEYGVIVCKAMLDQLNIKLDSCPPTLRVRVHTHIALLPVIGILDRALPHDYLFLLTEAGEQKLRTENPDPEAKEIRTGPIPDSWCKLTVLPTEVVDFLAAEKLRWVGPIRFGTEWVWRFDSEADFAPLLSRWEVYLHQIEAKLLRQRLKGVPSFSVPQPLRAQSPREVRFGYRMVGIYVNRPEDLDRLNDVLESLGHEPDRTVSDQLSRLRQSAAWAMVVLGFVTAIVGLLTLGNLSVIQGLRAQQKVIEIGMLKAMGLNKSMLRNLVLVETGAIWLAGMVLGVTLGWLLGHIMATNCLDPETGQSVTGFETPVWLLFLTIFGSGLVCVVGSLLATHSARNAAPIRTLGSG